MTPNLTQQPSPMTAAGPRRCPCALVSWLLLVLWLSFLPCVRPPALAAFPGPSNSPARTFSRFVVMTNSTITVTAAFTNSGDVPLRGFYYTDQLPSALTVTNWSATLNGNPVTNFLLETGQDGDVYSGHTPRRLVLEKPSKFAESNALSPQAWLAITYTLNSPTQGSFSADEFIWSAFYTNGTNALFGYSTAAQQQTLTFITNPPSATISSAFSADALTLQMDALSGATFVLLSSTNLNTWAPLLTNTVPFTFSDSNFFLSPVRFYRGQWLP
jgi:uncharacterized repeat protein (TIGR01451 family)